MTYSAASTTAILPILIYAPISVSINSSNNATTAVNDPNSLFSVHYM